MKLQGKIVMVLPEDKEYQKKEIIVPKTAKLEIISGKVINVGPGVEVVSPGDIILYGKNSATIVEIDNKEYHFIDEDKISFIYE